MVLVDVGVNLTGFLRQEFRTLGAPMAKQRRKNIKTSNGRLNSSALVDLCQMPETTEITAAPPNTQQYQAAAKKSPPFFL